jgi:hypothetical protein
MPYSNKLLGQELETYLNMGLRYITTAGIEKLKELEYSGTSTEVVKELPRLILPETVVPAYIDEIEKPSITLEQLRLMKEGQGQIDELEEDIEDTYEDELQGLQSQIGEEGQSLLNQGLSAVGPLMDQGREFIGSTVNTLQEGISQIGDILQSEAPQLGGLQAPRLGGLQMPDDGMIIGGALPNNTIPGGGPTIVINTDPNSMEMEGLSPHMGGRRVRRAPYYGGMMQPPVARYSPRNMGNESAGMSIPQSSNAVVTVNKME